MKGYQFLVWKWSDTAGVNIQTRAPIIHAVNLKKGNNILDGSVDGKRITYNQLTEKTIYKQLKLWKRLSS